MMETGMMAQAGADGNKGNRELINSCFQKCEDNSFRCLMCSETCARRDNIINTMVEEEDTVGMATVDQKHFKPFFTADLHPVETSLHSRPGQVQGHGGQSYQGVFRP